MDPDRPTPTSRAPLDDAALGVIVREVAEEWSLPPHRLDVPTWRDRVERGRRAGGRGSSIRWTRGLIGAAAVAVVATVSLSFAVAWLTTPRGHQGTAGSSASPGASSTPAPSGSGVPGIAASPMAMLVRNGDLPSPSRIMVQTGQGYHIVDLATGILSPVLIEIGLGPTALLARPSGGWVCICGNGQNGIRMFAQAVDANGVRGAQTHIRDVVGTYDPRASRDLQPVLADVATTVSPDGRLAFMGWVQRDAATGWRIGADVIDLDSLATVASTELLLDEPVDIKGHPRTRLAPGVGMSPAGDRILITSQWYLNDPNAPQQLGEADHWLASFDGRSIGSWAQAGITTDVCWGSGVGMIDAKQPIDDAVYYVTCWSPEGQFVLKRIAADGRIVSATEFPGSLAGIVTGTAARPSGDAFFSWNPFESVLSRLDLRSGELKTGEPQRPNRTGLTKPSGDLIVVSADGTRVYTLGIASAAGGSAETTGVYAFDASTLAPLGHWAAQADYTSIAVSHDGRHVYAAADGQPGVTGGPGPEFGASITAYNTSDGSVAVIAGRLLARDLALGEAICR